MKKAISPDNDNIYIKHPQIGERAYIEISLKNLEHNVNVLKKAIPPGCKIMAVAKGNAYGHGSHIISKHLNKIGIRDFAVSTIDEGIFLRKHGIKGSILILGYTNVYRAKELKKYDLTQTLISYDYAEALNAQAVRLKAHIKIDTGMHRFGIAWNEFSDIKRLFSMDNIKICGIYTHLCCSVNLEAEDIDFTKKQIECFYKLTDVLQGSGMPVLKTHIQSSYGVWNYPELKCDYVRAGAIIYGIHNLPDEKTKLKLDLCPVLSLKARIILIRRIKKGESFGYDRQFKADRDSHIAILPIGYGDGFPRSLSCGNGKVLIGDRYANVIGRICLDQLAVDVTDIENIAVGDIVTLLSADDNTEVSAEKTADRAGSFSPELLSRLGARLPIEVI